MKITEEKLVQEQIRPDRNVTSLCSLGIAIAADQLISICLKAVESIGVSPKFATGPKCNEVVALLGSHGQASRAFGLMSPSMEICCRAFLDASDYTTLRGDQRLVYGVPPYPT